MLLPGATAPVAVQSRSKLVCTCFNVTDVAIRSHLSSAGKGTTGNQYLASADEKLASLKVALKCGTNCGSCIPELKKTIRFTAPAQVLAQKF